MRILKKIYKKIYFFLSLLRYLYKDYIFLFSLKKNIQDIVVSDIMKFSSRLEKSINSKHFVTGRGLELSSKLINRLHLAFKNKIINNQILFSLVVLKKYVSLQTSNNNKNEKLLNEYNFFLKKHKLNGTDIKNYKSRKLSKNKVRNLKSFTQLNELRRSVRYFSTKKVNLNDINKALDVSQNTPSVCNRQGWKVFVFNKKNDIDFFRTIHKGFADKNNQPLNCLILITFNKNFFEYPIERHQGYTDSGLFSMSLVYALTDMGYATCTLNINNLTHKNEYLLRKRFSIPKNLSLVMFIAVGHYLKLNITPVSLKNNIKDFVIKK